MHVQFLKPAITDDDIAAVVAVLKKGWLVLSGETRNFEDDFSRYLGAKHAVLTNSCTCSLHLALIIAGIGKGDEVITTPLTYASSVSPILHVGAKPVFVDVEPTTGLIDVDLVARAITKKTKAILPVHLYGQMADMRALQKLAKKHKLIIIEDAAHSIEASRDGVRSGELGYAAAFSFHTAKNITSGQGGALVTNSAKVAEQAVILRRDGVVNRGVKRQMVALGFKYLSTDFDAAMLRSQLKRIDKQWVARKRLYDRYAKAFLRAGLRFNQVLPNSRHAYHMIVLWVDPKKRDGMIEKLKRADIDTSIHYDPLHLEPYYRTTFGFKPGDFPITETLGLGTITLPMHPLMTDAEQAHVVREVLKLL